MEHNNGPLLDQHGRPLSDHIQHVLVSLAPQLRRRFPALTDDVLLTEVLEEAGRQIVAREARAGPLQSLRGYAWVTLRHVAVSRMRASSVRHERATLRLDGRQTVLAALPSNRGSAERIERDILLKEVLTWLPPDDRRICLYKSMGFSAREIAERLQASPAAMDKAYSRAKQRVRAITGSPQQTITEPHTRRRLEPRATREPWTEGRDE